MASTGWLWSAEVGMIRCDGVTRLIGGEPGPRASDVGYEWRGVLYDLVWDKMSMKYQILRLAGFGGSAL